MADRFSPETRSRIMRAVRSENTRPERALADALGALGVEFDAHRKDLPGRPDFALRACRLAVFVHGCFWHRCRVHYKAPKTRATHWRRHIGRNVRRDRKHRRRLNALGWRTMVAWEHEDMSRAAGRVLARSRSTR